MINGKGVVDVDFAQFGQLGKEGVVVIETTPELCLVRGIAMTWAVETEIIVRSWEVVPT